MHVRQHNFPPVLMRVRSRLLGIARWFVLDPAAAWVTILGPLVALLVARYLPMAPEGRIRAAGFGVTLFGVALVAKAILDTQGLFRRQSLRSRTKAWLLRLPPLLRRSTVVSLRGTATLPAMTASGRVYVRSAPAQPSLEARVDAVEENVRRIDDRITTAERRMDDQIRRVESAVSSEQHARQEADDTLRARLEDSQLGAWTGRS